MNLRRPSKDFPMIRYLLISAFLFQGCARPEGNSARNGFSSKLAQSELGRGMTFEDATKTFGPPIGLTAIRYETFSIKTTEVICLYLDSPSFYVGIKSVNPTLMQINIKPENEAAFRELRPNEAGLYHLGEYLIPQNCLPSDLNKIFKKTPIFTTVEVAADYYGSMKKSSIIRLAAKRTFGNGQVAEDAAKLSKFLVETRRTYILKESDGE